VSQEPGARSLLASLTRLLTQGWPIILREVDGLLLKTYGDKGMSHQSPRFAVAE
jgi:hypothetical protein